MRLCSPLPLSLNYLLNTRTDSCTSGSSESGEAGCVVHTAWESGGEMNGMRSVTGRGEGRGGVVRSLGMSESGEILTGCRVMHDLSSVYTRTH